MKTVGMLALLSALIIVCVLQQFWIVQLKRGQATPAPPRATEEFDIKLLARSLKPPNGATDVGKGVSSELTGTSNGTIGFTGCLWIDISKAGLDGETHTEKRVAAVAQFYAQRLSQVIPGARIERAVDEVGMVESGSLHSTYIVRHADGHVVVCAGYKSLRDVPSQIGNVVKVHVISVNNSGNGVTTIMPSVPRPTP